MFFRIIPSGFNLRLSSQIQIKFKRMTNEDFAVAGHIQKGQHTHCLILAKYRNDVFVYKGHMTSGVTKNAVEILWFSGRNLFCVASGGKWGCYLGKAKSCMRDRVYAQFPKFSATTSIQGIPGGCPAGRYTGGIIDFNRILINGYVGTGIARSTEKM